MTSEARASFGLMLRLELQESLRSRWFHFYGVVLIGLMLLLCFAIFQMSYAVSPSSTPTPSPSPVSTGRLIPGLNIQGAGGGGSAGDR